MKLTNQQTNYPLTHWLILAVLLLVLIAAELFALHTVYTSKFPGGNDFFVRWLGGRISSSTALTPTIAP